MPLNTNIRITRSFLNKTGLYVRLIMIIQEKKNWFDDHAAVYKKIKSQLQLTENFEF